MKPSKFAIGSFVLGVILFCMALQAFAVTNNNANLMTGLLFFNLFLTMGIAYDIYRIQEYYEQKNGEFVKVEEK